jgi:4'-phosphopantetheinyl transferase
VQLNWPVPTEFPKLSANEVHLWAVALKPSQISPNDVQDLLSPEEQVRTKSYVVDKPREAFVISRCALRNILGRYLGQSPCDVAIANDSNGKPRLAGDDVHFNLAHSGNLALIAMTRSCEIGVDVERLRSVAHGDEIAARNFHSAELAAISATAEKDRDSVFLRCWTRKEAVLKAIGVGLGYPLDAFDTLTQECLNCVRIPAVATGPALRCWLYAADPSREYVAAVATLEPKRPPQGFTYSL